MNYDDYDYLAIYHVIKCDQELPEHYKELNNIFSYLKLLCTDTFFTDNIEIVEYMTDAFNLLMRLRDDNKLDYINKDILEYVNNSIGSYNHVVYYLNSIFYPEVSREYNTRDYYMHLRNIISNCIHTIYDYFFDNFLEFNDYNYQGFLDEYQNDCLYELYKLIIIYLKNNKEVRETISNNKDLSKIYTSISSMLISYIYANKDIDSNILRGFSDLVINKPKELLDDCIVNGVFLNNNEGIYYRYNTLINYEDQYMNRIISKINNKKKVKIIN